MTARIVLSALLLFVLAVAACAESWSADDEPSSQSHANSSQIGMSDAGATGNGIGTSPSLAGVKSCGLWFAHEGGIAAAESRHLAAPADPDLLQVPRPGGLSCSALLSVADVHPYFTGRSVVYYVTQEAP